VEHNPQNQTEEEHHLFKTDEIQTIKHDKRIKQSITKANNNRYSQQRTDQQYHPW
jgi:hypothetical protein